MKEIFGQIIFLISALKRSKAGKRHISYKKVILISNACQPACTDNVQPHLFIVDNAMPDGEVRLSTPTIDGDDDFEPVTSDVPQKEYV